MFKENCQYCGMELNLAATTCTYCGQVQAKYKKKKPVPSFATQKKSTPQPVITENPLTPTNVDTVVSTLRKIQAQSGQKQKTFKKNKKPGKISRVFFYLGLVWWWSLFKPILDTFVTPRGIFAHQLGEAQPLVASIILFFTLILFCRSMGRAFIAQVIASMSAFFLLIKPRFFPLEYSSQSSDGQIVFYPFSYTSETHLYFVIPGIILAITAFILSVILADRATK